MKRVNLDLSRLLGFKIVANHSCSTQSLKIGSKIGQFKIGSKIGTLKIGSKIGIPKGNKSK